MTAIPMKDKKDRLIYRFRQKQLRKVLKPGIKQATARIFAEYSLEGLIEELDQKNLQFHILNSSPK